MSTVFCEFCVPLHYLGGQTQGVLPLFQLQGEGGLVAGGKQHPPGILPRQEGNRFQLEPISRLAGQYPGRMLFSPGDRPALTLKLKKGEDPLRLAAQVVERYADVQRSGQ